MAYYDMICMKCGHQGEISVSMKEISKYKNSKCPSCGEMFYNQNYQTKSLLDIWNCGGDTRKDKYRKAKMGSQDALDGAKWNNDFLSEGRHIPDKMKYDQNKVKEQAEKMGYNG